MFLPRLMPVVLCLALATIVLAQPALRVVPATDGSCVGIASQDGKPLYFAGSGLGAVNLPQTPAQEGTLAFFFTPDWSPGDCTTHWMFELKGEGFKIAFRKGYSAAISPDYCYLLTSPDDAAVGFHPENLFRAREKHHYAIRWSTVKERIQFVVDGEASGRAGKFKFTGPASIPATLTLFSMACGTFSDVRIYPKYLSVPEITALAGRKQPAQYLQEQPPPQPAQPPVKAGEVPPQSTTRPVIHQYVDPNTGQLAVTEEDDQKELLPPYNPADHPDLPVTPHTKWARPLAGGKLRILFVATNGFYDEYSMIREAAELWQRLDCDIQVTDQPDPRVMSQDFDVIAVSLQGFTNGRWTGWADIDAKLRGWILERVKSGKSGLVWAYPTAPDSAIEGLSAPANRRSPILLLEGFPAGALPQANGQDGSLRWDKVYELDDSTFLTQGDAEKLVEVYDIDGVQAPALQRRLVKLNYRNASWYPNMGLTPDSALNAAATDVQYDEWMALAARAMLVAAGRETGMRIVQAQPAEDGWHLVIGSNPGFDRRDEYGMKLWYRARDAWGRVYATGERPYQIGNDLLSLPPLPPRCFVDLMLKNARGEVLAWYSAATPPPPQPILQQIRLDKPSYQRGDVINGQVALSEDLPADISLVVYLSDHEGRQLVRGQVKRGTPDASFALKIPNSAASLLMRVEAFAMRQANLPVRGLSPAQAAQRWANPGGPKTLAILDTRSADVPVPELTPRGFYPILYGTALNRFCDRSRHRLFRDQFGVRGGFHQGPHSWANLAALNLSSVEYSGHLGYPQSQADCEEFAENWEQNVTKWLMGPPEKMVPYRPLFYSLGEEHYVLMSACPTPTANAKFREWLKGKYGTLDKLNGIWGSKYATWDDITMMTPEIVDMLKIQFDVVRFENRRFMEGLFADRHAFLADYLRRVTVPASRGRSASERDASMASRSDAGTRITGDTRPHTGIHAGWDLWMGRGYDYWLLSRAMEDMMCYGGPHNHYARSFFQRYYGSHYHYNIGSHENVRWHPWYMLLSGAHGLSWYTDMPQIWGATTADMHLTSDWTAAQDEFKAVADAGELLTRTHYQDDQVAIHYSQDSFQAGVSDLTWMHQRFVNLCFDTGTPFRFVSYEQIEQGDLLKRKPKLLILPHSTALSEAECKGIRDYVAAGGVVWADVMPGTYNNFGQKLEQSQLADLFAQQQAPLPNTPGAAGGPGRVVLEDPGNYSYDRNVGQAEKALSLFQRVSRLAGVTRDVNLLHWDRGGIPAGIWTASWTNGSALHFAACKDYQVADREPATVTFTPRKIGHVYEMRAGKYLGKLEDITTTLQPTTGQVFTVLPYRVKGMSLQPVGRAARGQDLVLNCALQIEGTVGQHDLNVLQVRVTDPRGQEVTALRRTVEMRRGTYGIVLPVAYNDAGGKWTVTVRDLATGVRAQAVYQLEQGK